MAKSLEKGLKGFRQNWYKDLIAAVSVSFVALPISLALAEASGMNPLAGVISSVVGGIIVSILGGSYVTIVGPGNGLVVVLAGAIATIGIQDTLAATVISGALLLVFGFLRLGNLGDFFPSSAIQGLLAAIGINLFAKQFHKMLGVSPASSDGEKLSTIDYLFAIPDSVQEVFKSTEVPWIAIIGATSLLILFVYSTIRLKIVKFFPAAMWIVLLSVGFYYYFEMISPDPYPIASNFLLKLDPNPMDAIEIVSVPENVNTELFIAVIGITLISAIESLLSIKAIDKLDPYKRRSNLNKDLKALGVATMVSGLIGGLPVVTVIARSSINVNHGATSRVSNFFNGALVLIFVLFGGSILDKVPLAVLASILVYTGYKLANPKVFVNIYKIGKEQFLIFITTLVMTLMTNLTTGISIGILATLIIQVLLVKPQGFMLRYLLKTNTITYIEDQSKYYIGVKWFSNFFNYMKLKKQMDSIPRGNHMIVDFSLTRFVDHTVMEHIYHYGEEYKHRGGEFEVIGLDVHGPSSEHPFAARLFDIQNYARSVKALTRHQKDLRAMSQEMGWEFQPDTSIEFPELEEFPFFQTRNVGLIFNYTSGSGENAAYELFDIQFSEGALIAQEYYRATMMRLTFKQTMPEFVLDKETILDKVINIIGVGDIDFTDYSEFSKKFSLKGLNEEKIRGFFTHELIHFFETHPYYHIETSGHEMLIIKKERIATLSEIRQMVKYSQELAQILAK